MTKPNQDIGTAAAPFVAGDSKVLAFSVKDESGAALDISSASSIKWRMFAWPIPRAGIAPAVVASVSKSLGAGIAVISGPAGTLEVTLDPADTEDLVGAFYHELELTTAAGAVLTVASGRVTISLQRVR